MAFFEEIIYINKKKDKANVVNSYGKKSNGTRWVPLFINKNIADYFDSLINQSVITNFGYNLIILL